MHPELMRSLVREHRAVLLEQQQYRRKRRRIRTADQRKDVGNQRGRFLIPILIAARSWRRTSWN